MKYSSARDEFSSAMHGQRERVLLRWRQRINDEIPCSAVLSEALLFNTIPELYDYLTLSAAGDDAPGTTSLARAHGAERARQSGYRPADLLREFQVLRRCMAEIAEEEGLSLSSAHLLALGMRFDAVEREALEEYDLVRMREQELTTNTLSAMLRDHLNVAGIAAQRIMGTSNPERVGQLANRIRTRLAKVEELLENRGMHDLADTGRLPLLLSTFDLKALAQELYGDANLPGMTVQGDSVHVTWCRMSIRQALRNLLAEGNGSEGPVSITVRQGNGRAVLSVAHRHVLPPDVVRTLFSARNKEAHPTLREWGVGLGFVRDVAESHGGSAIVHSDATGTSFRLDIPTDASPFLAKGT